MCDKAIHVTNVSLANIIIRKNDKIDTVLFNDENDDGDDGDNDKHMLLELGQHHSNDDGGTINKVVEEVEPLTGVMFTVKDNDDDTLY